MFNELMQHDNTIEEDEFAEYFLPLLETRMKSTLHEEKIMYNDIVNSEFDDEVVETEDF